MFHSKGEYDNDWAITTLLRILAPVTWFCSRGWQWPYALRWLDALCDAYLDWFLRHTLGARMQRAADQGIGRSVTEMPPGSDVPAILAWFEQQVMTGPPLRETPALDIITCHLLHDSPGEHTPAGGNFPADYIGSWEGERRLWWSEGVSTIGALIPEQHHGLILVAQRASDVFRAAMLPPSSAEGAAYERSEECDDR